MNKFLIVIDMQHDFIDGSLGTNEAKLIIPNVLKKIEEFDGFVLYTKDTHTKKYLETEEGLNLPVQHCIKDTDGWKIKEEVYNASLNKNIESPLKTVYHKKTFACKKLAKDLEKLYKRNNNKIELELIGLCTDICVISNALMFKGFMPEAKITVDSSCCAGVNVNSHNNALKAMEMCQIKII